MINFFQDFCKTFNFLREIERLKPDSWFQMDFESCFNLGHEECRFISGQGGWKDWDLAYDPVTGTMFSCNRPQVLSFIRKKVLC